MNYFFLALLLTLASFPAQAQIVKTTGGNALLTVTSKPVTPGPSPYVGPVATATMLPNTLYTTASSSAMTRKAHVMRAATTRVKFAYANWRVDPATNNYMSSEVGTGNAINVSAWVEYPVGTYTQVLFGGASSTAIADLSTSFSDFLSITIPKGAVFYSWTYVTPSGGNNFPYYTTTQTGNPLWITNGGGEKAIVATTGVPATPGAFSDNYVGRRGYFPAAIIGDTSQPSFCLIGDSRTTGVYDIEDASYDLGNLARSIGSTNAYLNMGVSGDRMAAFTFSSTNRMALLNASGCSNIIVELGINEFLQQSASATIWEALNQSLMARFNGKVFSRTTMEPCTTSTDNFQTTANQSACATGASITTSNQWVRAMADGVPYSELSTPVSTALDSGIWRTNGLPLFYTHEGYHATQAAVWLQVASHNINPRTLAANGAIAYSYPSLTLTGASPSFTTGEFSQGATLSAAQTVAMIGIVPGVPPMTLEGWVYMTAYPSTASGSQPIAAGSSFIFQQTTGNVGIRTAGGTVTFSSTPLGLNGWHHLALTMGPQTVGGNIYYTLYLDGSQVLQTNAVTSATNWGNQFGLVLGNTYFTGRIDEVALWNTIKYSGTFMPPTSPYAGTESGLVGVWHLDNDLTGTRGPAGM